MQCPLDATTLLVRERQGVEIDYCPQCRGVWLDRGELDKLIDRDGGRRTWDRDWDDDEGRFFERGPRRRKKKGWLSEMFEPD